MGSSTSRAGGHAAVVLVCRGGEELPVNGEAASAASPVVARAVEAAAAAGDEAKGGTRVPLGDVPASAAATVIAYAKYHRKRLARRPGHRPSMAEAAAAAVWDAKLLARLDEDAAGELEHAAAALEVETLRRLACARIGELSPDYRRTASVPLEEAARAGNRAKRAPGSDPDGAPSEASAAPEALRAAVFDREKLMETTVASLAEGGVEVALGSRAEFDAAADEALAGVHVVITTVACPVGEAVMKRLPALRAVVTLSVGVDHVDVEAAKARSVRVYSSPGSNANAVAEHAVALMLSVQRRLHLANSMMRAREWDSFHFLGRGLDECTVGFVGFGRIAQRVAARLVPFGARFVVFDRLPAEQLRDLEPLREGRGRVVGSLDELLGAADIVSLHVPLLPSTRGMIGDAQFAAMRPGAVVINTARGGVIDDAALLRALQEGSLSGAGLDVYTTEPPEYAVTDELLKHEGVILTPHIGAMTRLAREKMQSVAVGWLCSDIAAGALHPAAAAKE